MLDDFREQAQSSPLFVEEDTEIEELPVETRRQFLGMTPAQRFVVVFLLFIVTVILSTFCLWVTGKIILS